jgi:hypothetical protein
MDIISIDICTPNIIKMPVKEPIIWQTYLRFGFGSINLVLQTTVVCTSIQYSSRVLLQITKHMRLKRVIMSMNNFYPALRGPYRGNRNYPYRQVMDSRRGRV